MPDEYRDPLVAQQGIVFNNILRLVSPDFSQIEHELCLILSFDHHGKSHRTKTS
jgi:hypothetical protein